MFRGGFEPPGNRAVSKLLAFVFAAAVKGKRSLWNGLTRIFLLMFA
jgi:hypothetical protein